MEKEIEKTLIKSKQIISDVAGNLFIIIEYDDLDGIPHTEIKPYNPDEFIYNNIKIYNHSYCYK